MIRSQSFDPNVYHNIQLLDTIAKGNPVGGMRMRCFQAKGGFPGKTDFLYLRDEQIWLKYKGYGFEDSECTTFYSLEECEKFVESGEWVEFHLSDSDMDCPNLKF